MKTEKVNGHTITYYDGDVTELPAGRFQKFNKFLLLDSGIGGDIQDVDNHIERLRVYVHKDTEKALLELENMRQNIYLIMRGITPKHLAFCTLIFKINGEPVDDMSDEGIKALHKRLNDVPARWFEQMFRAVKKKLMRS